MSREWKVAPSAARGNQVSLGGVFATPPPVLSGDQYAQLLRDAWGLTVGSVRPLPSERDQNFALQSDAGEKFVLNGCVAWQIPFALAAHTDI